MNSLASRASKHLRDSQTTGFSTPSNALLIYAGSFLWFSILVAADAFALVAWNVQGGVLVPTIATSLLLNVFMFILQTVNTIMYQFKLWAIVSLYWTCQLTSIGIASAWVGYALLYPELHDMGRQEADDNRVARIWLLLARLFAQCLFTASQLSVMLEYLHRAVERRAEDDLPHLAQIPRPMRRIDGFPRH